MSNGQINAVSMLNVAPSAMQDAPLAATMDNARQGDGGNFAEVLSGVRKTETSPESGQTEQAENLSVDLLSGWVQVAAALESPVTKQNDPEKPEVGVDAGVLRNEADDLASQAPMFFSAYVQAGRMPEVNISTPVAVDTLQNVAAATEQPVTFKSPVEALPADMLQNVAKAKDQSVIIAAATAEIPSEQSIEKPVMSTERHAASLLTKSDESRFNLSSDVSKESGIETNVSQPVSIAARVTAAPVLADNRSGFSAQEIQNAQQRLSVEQQIEKPRTDNEKIAVEEPAPSIEVTASAGELSLGSDNSKGAGSNQGQSDVASGNQMLAHDMRELKIEQRANVISEKDAKPEAVLPEQVAKQVGNRLAQHDVKQGNQQITLTLTPENLGELKMNLNLQGQKLSVEIVAENRTVRDAIVQHVDALKESLARQNITMESFDVTTGGKGSANQGQNQNAWRELAKQQEQQQFWTSSRGYQIAQADLPSGQAAYQRQKGQSMLDIHY